MTLIRMARKNTTLLALLVCSVGALLAINLLYFPLSVPWMVQHTGVPFLDALPFRDAAKTYETLDALGPAGRRNHLYFTWTIDLALPVLFGSFLYAAMRNGSELAFGVAGRLCWLAVAAVIVDYMENISNSVLLAAYPRKFPILAAASGPLTLTKFLLSGACCLIAIAMFSIGLAKRRKALAAGSAENRTS